MRPRRISDSRGVNDEIGSLMIEFPRLGSRGKRNRVAIPTVSVASPSNV